MPRTVKLEEFFTLPVGTIFSYLDGLCVSGLFVKEETIYHDGVASDFFQNGILAEFATWVKTEKDQLPPYQEIGQYGDRWGIYEDDAEFVVYDEADTLAMIRYLTANPLKFDRSVPTDRPVATIVPTAVIESSP